MSGRMTVHKGAVPPPGPHDHVDIELDDGAVVRYRDPARLLSDLKGVGEQSALAPGMIRPLPRAVLERALSLYRERHVDSDGRVRASFEIVHVSGWAPAPGQPKPLKPGSARASLADAVRRQSEGE